MISAVLILNHKGHVLISRSFRDDVDPRSIASAFRSQIISTKLTDRCPVKTVGSVSFLWIRHEDMYLVSVTRQNVNASMVFQFLYKLIAIFKAYFEGKFDETSLKENFALVYELLDEILDFGYPQNCEPDVLKSYITIKGLKEMQTAQDFKATTAMLTGAVNWRKPGLKYKKNEVFIDVIESVNMLLSPKGTVLNSDVTGKVVMKSFLSGMPMCKFGLNDRLMMQNERKTPGRKYKEIEIDDVTFHQCVKLGKFDSDRTIDFIPPDGEFELMRYRITDGIAAPFRLVSPMIRELGKTRLEVSLIIKAVFNHRIYGKNVVVKIPIPKNTAKCKSEVTTGKAKYKADQSAIVWTIKRFPGESEFSLHADVELISSTLENKKWSKAPINLDFQVPMFTGSGLHVRFLKVVEQKQNYQAIKWVRYITQAGNYEQRV